MIVYAWARFDAGRVLGAHASPEDATDILPRVAWPSAEEARDAAEAAYLLDWGGSMVPPPPLAWMEDYERPDGRYPVFNATPTELIELRVYPIELIQSVDPPQRTAQEKP